MHSRFRFQMRKDYYHSIYFYQNSTYQQSKCIKRINALIARILLQFICSRPHLVPLLFRGSSRRRSKSRHAPNSSDSDSQNGLYGRAFLMTFCQCCFAPEFFRVSIRPQKATQKSNSLLRIRVHRDNGAVGPWRERQTKQEVAPFL